MAPKPVVVEPGGSAELPGAAMASSPRRPPLQELPQTPPKPLAPVLRLPGVLGLADGRVWRPRWAARVCEMTCSRFLAEARKTRERLPPAREVNKPLLSLCDGNTEEEEEEEDEEDRGHFRPSVRQFARPFAAWSGLEARVTEEEEEDESSDEEPPGPPWRVAWRSQVF